jgi:hypothetical protein
MDIFPAISAVKKAAAKKAFTASPALSGGEPERASFKSPVVLFL